MPKVKAPVLIFQTPSRRFYLWADMVKYARANPNRWLPVLWNVPRSAMRSVEERRHPDLKNIPGGTFAAEARNEYRDEDGTRMCDLFVRWTPEGDT